jgi:large repetitive protein
VTFTNLFTTAPLVVRKVVDGDGAEFAPPMPPLPDLPTTIEEALAFDWSSVPFAEFPYVVSLECTTSEGVPVETVPGGPDRRFGPGFPALWFGLQDGDTCTVTEVEDGGATTTVIDPNPVTIVGAELPAEPVEVVVTNTYDTGAIEVTKVVDGEGAESFGTGPFTMSAACTFEGAEIEVPGGTERVVAGGEVAVFDGLPIGAECVVTETAVGGASSSTVSAVEGGEPGVVTIAPDPAAVTVTNTFDVGQVVVTKELDGPGAAEHEGDEFVVSLACTWDVDGVATDVVVPGGAERTLSAADDWTAVYEQVPQGATCTVAETDSGDAESVAIVVDAAEVAADPADGVPTSDPFDVPVGNAAQVDASVTNTFPSTGDLARTGSTALAATALAVLLLVTGAILVAIRRRQGA